MSYFKFEEEFKDVLDMTVFTEEDETLLADNIIRAVYTFYPPVNTSEHIIEKPGYGKVINTQGRSTPWKNEFPNNSTRGRRI